MKLSKYLTLDEAIKSPTAIKNGIANFPNPEQLEAMRYVAVEVFDKVREFVGGPLYASSFFRSPELNRIIGGSSKTSQHMTGEAIDIDCDVFRHGNNAVVFFFIKNKLAFDQLIGEYPNHEGNFAWVHVSLRRDGRNRHEVLIKLTDRYIPFDQWRPGMV